MFSKEFLKSNNFIDSKVVGKFPSKRNHLYLVNFDCIDGSEKRMVFKLHSYKNRLTRETEMLFQLKHSPVMIPEINKVVGNGILMEYVSGPTILYYIEWQEKIHFQYNEPYITPGMQAINQLVDWLNCFYITTRELTGKQIILGNMNLNNFIIRKYLYGVDFEDCREGAREEDVSLLCAFTLTYNPPYTAWKKKFVKEMMGQFVNKLALDRNLVNKKFLSELERINKRRGFRKQTVDTHLFD